MRKEIASRGWLWARTLYLFFAVALFWLSCLNWDAFLYGTVFVMAPWTVLLVAGGAARGQIRRNTYHVLLFAMSAIYVFAALRNGNMTPRGLLVLALGFSTVWTGVRAFSNDGGAYRRRGLMRAGFFVLLAALVALLLTSISEFFGRGDWLPWAAKRAVVRGARSGGDSSLLLRKQTVTLKGLTVLTYACGAILVAGIVPKEADAAYLRREGRALCLLLSALLLTYLIPAVATVFTGSPIEAEWLPSKLGIQSPGLVSDRIWALQHPNSTAINGVVGVFCMIYCMHRPARRWLRIPLALACVVFVMGLAHSQSRTSSIVLGIGLGAMAFRRVWLHRDGLRWRRGIGILAWGLTLVLAVLLVSGVFTVDVLVATRMGAAAESNLLDSLRQSAADKKAEEEVETPASDNPVEVADGVMVPRTLAAGMLDVFSNGRDEIWRDGLDYLIHNPRDLLFGMGSGDILERMKAYNPDRYDAKYLHSGFLEALARGGVLMLAALVWALCLLVKPTARMLMATDDALPGEYVFAVMTGALALFPLVESLLFTDATVYNLLFFYAAGRVMYGQTSRQIVPAN